MYPIRIDKKLQFDVDSLLGPIPVGSPTRQSLRYEGSYHKIRDYRPQYDTVLSRGLWKSLLKRAAWSHPADLCVDPLQNHTKDVQIAAWLTEAWLHLYGFQGLREGLRAIAELCQLYWDDLFPAGEDGDSVEYRVAPIDWINDRLPAVVRLLSLTEPASDDILPYCWNDWESATRPRPADSPTEGASQAQFQQSVMLTPTPFYVALLNDLESAADASVHLESLLEERCGNQAPSLRGMAETLNSIRGLIASILGQRDIGQPAAEAVRPDALSHDTGQRAEQGTTAAAIGTGPILNRTDAYRRLADAAEYLARTEPHSPTPYLIRRAIAWGSMRLEDLLPELVRDDRELHEIFRLLQLPRPNDR